MTIRASLSSVPSCGPGACWGSSLGSGAATSRAISLKGGQVGLRSHRYPGRWRALRYAHADRRDRPAGVGHILRVWLSHFCFVLRCALCRVGSHCSGVVKRLVDLAGDPEAVQQHRELPRHRHHCPPLGVLAKLRNGTLCRGGGATLARIERKRRPALASGLVLRRSPSSGSSLAAAAATHIGQALGGKEPPTKVGW